MEHLALEVFDRDGSGSKYAFLPSDTSITITDTSEIFDSGDIWSHAFKLNIPANAHIFGSAGEIHGSRLHEQIDKRRARLWVEGLPLYYGYLRLDDEVDVDEYGDVNVSFESGQKTFYDMVDGIKANQVPISDDIMIGMALDRERTLKRTGVCIARWRNGAGRLTWDVKNCTIVGDVNFSQMYPKYVFAKTSTWRTSPSGGTSEQIYNYEMINVDTPFDNAHPYCNTRVCYQRKEWKNNNGAIEENSLQEYKVSEPLRINPSPNFFVLYWYKMLMKHLNIYIDENQLVDIEDMRRLFFVNTKCAYKTKGVTYYGSGGMIPVYGLNDQGNPIAYAASPFVPIDSDESRSYEIEFEVVGGTGHLIDGSRTVFRSIGQADDGVNRKTWHKAYATSDNFPDVDIKDVVEAIGNGFGVRLIFSKDYKKVRMVLLRNILRSNDVQEIPCDITEVTKQENSIRGFRLTYGGSDDDTNFVYKGFANSKINAKGGWIAEEDSHDYSQFDTSLRYSSIKDKVGMLNKTCYIDRATGNAYIVKIDSNFKNMKDSANPAIFNCADFMDAEDGDCTGEEETIKEVRIGFSPMIANSIKSGGYALFVNEEMSVPCNDSVIKNGSGSVHMKKGTINTSTGGGGGFFSTEVPPGIEENGTTTVDESDANGRSGLFEIATETSFKATTDGSNEIFTIDDSAVERNVQVKISGMIREGYRMYLEDNYKPNDDMECPLEKHDWGLTLGIMRGSNAGSRDTSVKYLPDGDDKEGNDYWYIKSGSIATSHPDICDDDGNGWIYSAVSPENIAYTGYEFGDKLLSDYGCQNLCDLKNRKGPVPSGVDTFAVIDSYLSYSRGSEIIILTDSGYYAAVGSVIDANNITHTIWLCCVCGGTLWAWYATLGDNGYINYLQHGTNNTRPANVEEILQRDSIGHGELSNMIIAVDPTGSIDILKTACHYFLKGNNIIHVFSDDQISLKLRAEKPNPYFDPTRPESPENQRFLEISNPALRNRGLADRFYKEYSYWVRNARISKMKVRMELAQLLGIDMTKRVRMGDITGFIKKMQYNISVQNGMGLVDIEIWYL